MRRDSDVKRISQPAGDVVRRKRVDAYINEAHVVGDDGDVGFDRCGNDGANQVQQRPVLGHDGRVVGRSLRNDVAVEARS